MLDRFICPASKLGELPRDAPRLSVVLDGGEGDLETVVEAVADGREVELVEARIDPEWIPDTQALVHAEAAGRAGVLGAAAGPRAARARSPRSARPARERRSAAAARRCRRSRTSPRSSPRAATPACGSRRPPACTTRSGSASAHGFLNLLAAAVFAHAEGLGEDELATLLAEEDPAAFTRRRRSAWPCTATAPAPPRSRPREPSCSSPTARARSTSRSRTLRRWGCSRDDERPALADPRPVVRPPARPEAGPDVPLVGPRPHPPDPAPKRQRRLSCSRARVGHRGEHLAAVAAAAGRCSSPRRAPSTSAAAAARRARRRRAATSSSGFGTAEADPRATGGRPRSRAITV